MCGAIWQLLQPQESLRQRSEGNESGEMMVERGWGGALGEPGIIDGALWREEQTNFKSERMRGATACRNRTLDSVCVCVCVRTHVLCTAHSVGREKFQSLCKVTYINGIWAYGTV